MLAQAVGPLLADETAVSDAHGFRTYLESTVGAFFDYLLGHPRLVRIPTWEMAGGWKIFAEIAEGFPSENGERFEALFREAWDAGLLRFPAHDPIFDARAGMHGPSLFFPPYTDCSCRTRTLLPPRSSCRSESTSSISSFPECSLTRQLESCHRIEKRLSPAALFRCSRQLLYCRVSKDPEESRAASF